MSNDTERLDFTLRNFKKHNPNVPVLVYNNGGNFELAKKIAEKYRCEYKYIENIWHKKTHCGTGSFNFRWFELLFEYALQEDDYTHILFLETDVYTQKKIATEPLYDMAGPLSFCGPKENILFGYFKLEKYGYKFIFENNSRAFPHTGCGGTIYKKDFFVKSKENLHLIQKAYEEMIPYCFMDLLITILGMISGCSIGDWQDTSNLYGKYIYNTQKNIFYLKKCDWKAPMIHHIKYISDRDLLIKKIKSIFINNYLRSKLVNLINIMRRQ